MMIDRFERNRDFEFDMRERYAIGVVLSGAPNTTNQVQVNPVDPYRNGYGWCYGWLWLPKQVFPQSQPRQFFGWSLMEQWEIIRNNPQFQSAFGNQVTGDPNQWWNSLPAGEKHTSI